MIESRVQRWPIGLCSIPCFIRACDVGLDAHVLVERAAVAAGITGVSINFSLYYLQKLTFCGRILPVFYVYNAVLVLYVNSTSPAIFQCRVEFTLSRPVPFHH